MNRTFRLLLGVVVCVSASVATRLQAASLLLDFGAGGVARTTEHGPSPDDPQNYWNNVTDAVGTNATGQLLHLITTLNTPTETGLLMLSRFNAANEAGTGASTLFPTDATRDSLYGNTELFNGLSNIFPSFKLTGLNPTFTYNFTFYASRTAVGDNRETGYTVTGANSGLAVLNAANNIANVATVSGITPDAAGEITISLAPGPNNNNAVHFTHLGVMKLDEVTPTPIGFTLEPVSQRIDQFLPVTFSASVTGTPPYFITWLSNGVAIPGANQFTYTIPFVTTDMNGALFAVTVSNLTYSATSSNAVLQVVPLAFLPAVVTNGQATLNWTGTGQLEWAPTVLGPWTPITPAPIPSYSEAIGPGQNRFFRLRAVSAPLPLGVSANRRHLVDANGSPFLMIGDTAWFLIPNATKLETEEYLENRRQKGYNAVLVEMITQDPNYVLNPPRNRDGDGPFTTPGDFSTPNEAYFAHVDWVVSKAAEKGILVFLFPAYMGYGGVDEWWGQIIANGPTKCRGYGRYLGNRYRNFTNVVWVHGGDFNPPRAPLE